MPIWEDDRGRNEQLTDAELHAFFDRLFPQGFAGADVLAEIAPEGLEHSPLVACFHPSVEQEYEEAVQFHRNLESLRNARPRRDGSGPAEETSSPEPTLEEMRREYQPEPVTPHEEVTELVGLCLWDVFSDNHDVITADGHVCRYRIFPWCRCVPGRTFDAWLTPVYAMIFRRLRLLGTDWVYHLPQLYLTELAPIDAGAEGAANYSVSESAAAELKTQKRSSERAEFHAEIDEMNMHAREEALDRSLPATVRTYGEVYGRDPRGWPPA